MAVVMGVLIVSFGIWGIADIFRGFGQSTLAKVGHTEISMNEFRQIYTDRIQQIGRQFGRPLTMEQARALGFDRQVLNQTLAEAALDEETRQLGLGQSDAETMRVIYADPNFKGLGGGFDPARFQAIIRQYGFTEARYLDDQRKVSLRRQLAGTVTAGLEPSKTLLESLNHFQNEKRSIDYLRLGAAQAGTIDPPSPEALAAYFDEHKAQFRAPEYRKIAFVAINPEDIGKWSQISDEDAKKLFEQRKDKYGSPEKRQVSQIVFPNMDGSRGSAQPDRIGHFVRRHRQGAQSWRSRRRSRSRRQIGHSRSGDRGCGFRAACRRGQPAGAGQIRRGVGQGRHHPAGDRAGLSKRGSRTQETAGDRARARGDRKLAQQDGRRARWRRERGRRRAEARADGRHHRCRGSLGPAPNGQRVGSIPQGLDVVAQAFNSDVGVDNDAISYRGGYVWYDVLGITPSRERTLDEVKDQVEARWRADQISSRLQTKATEMVQKLSQGGSLADEATAAGVKVETATGFKREDSPAGVPAGAVTAAFRTAKDGYGQTPGPNNEWIVFRVTDVTVPPVDLASDDMKKLKDQLVRGMTDEQVAQYVAKLEKDIGTTVNEAGFAQVTGANNN